MNPEDVQRTADRIAASSGFVGSDQLTRFLRFVVQETLAGRGDRLKEQAIGVGAFGRPDTFDPTTDSVVRVQARQLRFKLAEYFAGEGRDEVVVIELPKGSYVPVFSRRAAGPAGPRPPEPAHPSKRPRGVWVIGIGVAVVVAVMIAAGPWAGHRTAARSAATVPPQSIVVLPFLNLTGAANQEYVSDGLTEEVTAALTKVPGLAVIARTSAFRFKNRPYDVRDIGRRLGVDVVLEGSVRSTGGTLRVTAQLARASDGVHLWAATYDRDARDLLSVQETIAGEVMEAMRARLAVPLESATRRTTEDAEAYALYLQGRFFWNKRTLDGMNRAIALYREAVRRDSSFALAYAGLAAVHAVMAVNSMAPPGVAPPLAEAAARKALSLDSSLGEAHATLGLMRAFNAWDWEGADREFRLAIALSPNYATARSWFANTLMARGRLDEALDQLRRASQLDPLSLPIRYAIGEALIYAHRPDEAAAQARTMLELDSSYTGAYNLLGRAFAQSGRYADAESAMVKAGDTLGNVLLHARLGQLPRAEAVTRLSLRADLKTRAPFSIACMFAWIGERDSALAWLGQAYRSRQPDLVSITVEPALDSLRTDPRYRDLVAKVGLSAGP